MPSATMTKTSFLRRISSGGGYGDEKVVGVVVGGGGGRSCDGESDETENRADCTTGSPPRVCCRCCCSFPRCAYTSSPSSPCPDPASTCPPCLHRHHRQHDSHLYCHRDNANGRSCSSGDESRVTPGPVLRHNRRHHPHQRQEKDLFYEDDNHPCHHFAHSLPARQQQQQQYQQQQQKQQCFMHDMSRFVLRSLMRQTKSDSPLTNTHTTIDSAVINTSSAFTRRLCTVLWLLVLTVPCVLPVAYCSSPSPSPSDEDDTFPPDKELHYDLMVSGGYNALVKPSGGPNNQLTVKMGLRLSQILDVDEQNQIITISVWLRQEWYDRRLQWNPDDYRGVHHLNIPSDDLWKPDIVLYNNADGDFVVTLKTKATVYYNGKIVWEPPAIYKSFCPIDVEFFPFDIQECFMKFSSWTYHGGEVDLQHVCNGTMVGNKLIIPRGIDMKDYYYNIEWDVLNVTARRNVKYYPCCDDPYPDITFTVTLRRRILFYTLNLIIPCISISCLAVLVFYLPSDSGEKISLSISILLALTVFFLLLSDMTPPTSLVIPLIGKYLLFIMIVVTASIFLTVLSLHIHFKSPTTDVMSPWVKRIFTEILPKVLLMKRPEVATGVVLKPVIGADEYRAAARQANGIEIYPDGEAEEYENLRQRHESGDSTGSSVFEEIEGGTSLPKEVKDALKGVRYIASHFRRGDVELVEERDWKYISMVIDRFFLYIFSTACLVGTLTIFLYAPSLYDPRDHLALEDPNSSCTY